jgi:alcohol dehydrogenase class IV
MNQKFTMAPAPLLHFGEGKISQLPGTIIKYGSKFLLVTGSTSFVSSPYFEKLREQFASAGLTFIQWSVGGEPTPGLVDHVVRQSRSFKPDVVVAIGGGSALDAGKAISAMIPLEESVKHYLEGIGSRFHSGVKIPFIAVPTTAGTGSEAARNAVLSETGPNGYKRSLRHDNFVPNVAILDPMLALTCPKETTAATGMDAFTQLLESYLSPAGNRITDAVALDGLSLISSSLITAFRDGSDPRARAGMALAAYLSGVTLTNAGLGLIHGFASSIGGFFPIAHGMICSALMAPVNILTVRKLRSENATLALKKYATVGKIFSNVNGKKSDNYYIDTLLEIIQALTAEMKIPSLRDGGVASDDFGRIINVTDNKNNPAALNKEEMVEVLEWNGRRA